jgi:hypothetical protein
VVAGGEWEESFPGWNTKADDHQVHGSAFHRHDDRGGRDHECLVDRETDVVAPTPSAGWRRRDRRGGRKERHMSRWHKQKRQEQTDHASTWRDSPERSYKRSSCDRCGSLTCPSSARALPSSREHVTVLLVRGRSVPTMCACYARPLCGVWLAQAGGKGQICWMTRHMLVSRLRGMPDCIHRLTDRIHR